MRKLLFSVLLAAAPLFGGTLIEWQVKKGSATTQRKMLLEDSRFRVEDADSAMTFHEVGGQWVMDIWDKKANRLNRIDQQFVNQISQQMKGINEQMQAAMAKMDAKQKVMVEQLMKGKMAQVAPAAAVPQTVYTATGNSTVAGFACREYDGRRANQVVRKVCAAQQASLNIAASRYQVFDRMREFAAKLQSSIQNSPMGASFTSIAEPGYEGIAIRQVTLQNGQTVEEETVTSIREEAFNDNDFSNGNATPVPMPSTPARR